MTSSKNSDEAIQVFIVLVVVALCVLATAWVSHSIGYQEGYCEASQGAVLGNDACDVEGKVVYLP